MPRHLIGDAHEWINEIPTVPTHSLAKLQPSQRSWDLYLCFFVSHEYIRIAHNYAGLQLRTFTMKAPRPLAHNTYVKLLG